MNDKELFNILECFAMKLVDDQEDLPPEFDAAFHENLWDLLDDERLS